MSDYEILEVRESRMILKTAGTEKGIKIGGGRETLMKATKEEPPVAVVEMEAAAIAEQRTDKRRERRRYKKRRGKNEGDEETTEPQEVPFLPEETKEKKAEKPSLIPPPSTLISETITRYKVLPLSDEPVSEEKKFKPLTPPPRVEKEHVDHEEEDEEIPF